MVDGWPGGLDAEVADHLARLEKAMGKRLGDATDPLLVSVRSGAKFSMPGMMDTVLNLGLNDESVKGLAQQTNDERFANDSYRRFIQMYGKIVLDIPGEEFDELFEAARERSGVASDAEIPADALAVVISDFKAVVEKHTGKPFPQEPRDQLRGSIEAVFSSWNSPRAVAYRRRERIPDDLGTAVNVQTMVFGNRDNRSGTGVGFTRNPATGEAGAYGDFLINAQGEDVVAGIRNTLPLAEMNQEFPVIYRELLDIFERLELHYRDMLDTEFTIDQDKLWMLQTRVGKRTGAAALRIAVALTTDSRIKLTAAEAVMRVNPEHLEQVLHPQFEKTDATVLGTGLAASPGAAVGKAYFDADRCAEAFERGEQVVLVRQETSPEDVHGMAVAEGILTSRGGLVSHAAVVARGWGKPAVCGAESLDIGADTLHDERRNGRPRGRCHLDRWQHRSHLRRRSEAGRGQSSRRSSKWSSAWADEIRKGHLGIRANADTGEDAARARELRRRGHRPVPYRAHVPGRSTAGRAGHDPRRHARRRNRGARGAVAGAAGRLRGGPRGDGRVAGHGAAARSAAARVPSAGRGAGDRGGTRRPRAGGPRPVGRGPQVAGAEPHARPSWCAARNHQGWSVQDAGAGPHGGRTHRARTRAGIRSSRS